MSLAGLIASCGGRSQVSPREALVAAVGPSRVVEGRLTGGFPFGPHRSGAPAPFLSDPAVRRIVQQIEKAAGRQRSPQSLADRGIVRLLDGRLDEAIASLEAAVTRAPEDPRHWSDLAAAYLARADARDQPSDLIRALAAADRATRHDPSLPEGRFNRALALKKLFLITDERQAWREIAREEKDPAWAREAERHLLRLNKTPEREIWKTERERLDRAALQGEGRVVTTIVDRFRQPARQYAEEEVLTSWAAEMTASRPAEAERFLQIARAIGDALFELHGDAMVRDGVAVIDAARSAEPASCLHCLVRGHLLYGEGARRIAVQTRDIEGAVQAFTEAEEQLRRAGSPFVFWARFHLAVCDYFRPEYSRVREALRHLWRDVPAGRYLILNGRISYVLGSTEVLTGRPGEALPFVREAGEAFTRTGETENLVMTHELFAFAFDDLGESDEALRHLLLALRERGQVHNPARVFAVVDQAAINCLRRGEIGVARYFQNELVSDALTQRIPSFVSFAHQRRARTFYLAGQYRKALRDLEEADRETLAIPDGGIRQRQQAEVRLARGEIQIAAGKPAGAILSLSPAIGFFEDTGLEYYLSIAYFVRSRAHIALEDETRADLDFRAGLRAIEQARDSAPPGALRISLYDQATTLFDEFLSYQARRGARDRAFEISERVRGRLLLDRSRPVGTILGIREVQRRLPRGTVLLKYVVLPDRLLLWALSNDKAELQQIPLDAGALAAQVEKARALLRQNAPEPALGTILRDLHRRLLAPVAGTIRTARALVVVPDKILHLLPFAALVDPTTGRYLIQDHALSVAPSANVYIHCLERARPWSAGPPTSALVVAADAFDRSQFPQLSPLPHAAEEAQLIAAAYPRSRLLAGGEATREKFLDLALQGPQVIHFAGHAVVNPEHPDLSMFVLARHGGKNGSTAVYSHEVDGLKLSATRLVVLSACSTAAGRISASEGATSLARSFLAAGVPAVLASLWEIDDPVASRFFAELHRRLRAGEDPIHALRTVQLSELGTAPPAEWAAFQFIGGVPPSFQEEMRSWPSR